MSLYDRLVGQQHVVELLRHAVAGAQDTLDGQPGHAMTHAWLFTGPPGSGRSTAARIFAAALQCLDGGCDHCQACRTAMRGTHADVHIVATEGLSIKVDEVRELVLEASAAPTQGRWRVIIVEDADRLTEQANNALLKTLEEPVPHTVWLLCAPSVEDLLPTIRSRTRQVQLVTPSAVAVAEYLVSHDGVDPAIAAFAARASQGHIGRARGLATDEATRLSRSAVLALPLQLHDLGQCMLGAQDLIDAAETQAATVTTQRDGGERDDLARALGVENPKRVPNWARTQFKDLRDAQKARQKRSVRDALDRSLLDLASFYRDVLMVQSGADVPLVNDELSGEVSRLAVHSTPEGTLRRIEAIVVARERIQGNAAPQLAVENLMLTLARA
jgi:DNA polymerase III subunit delta'